MAERQMLGVPRPDRQGRWRKGAWTEGRFRLSSSPGRSDWRSVQVGPVSPGYLPDHEHWVEQHADAILPGLALAAGPLGSCLLRPLPLRLQGSADRRTAEDSRHRPKGARRSQAWDGITR